MKTAFLWHKNLSFLSGLNGRAWHSKHGYKTSDRWATGYAQCSGQLLEPTLSFIWKGNCRWMADSLVDSLASLSLPQATNYLAIFQLIPRHVSLPLSLFRPDSPPRNSSKRHTNQNPFLQTCYEMERYLKEEPKLRSLQKLPTELETAWDIFATPPSGGLSSWADERNMDTLRNSPWTTTRTCTSVVTTWNCCDRVVPTERTSA